MSESTSGRRAAYLNRCPPEWPRMRFDEVGQVQAGKALSSKVSGTQRPYLRVANVFDGYISANDVLSMPFSEQEWALYRLRPGDVLLNEGQSLHLVGRAAAYRGHPIDCGFQNSLVRFRAGNLIDDCFALELCRHLQVIGVFSEIALQTTSVAHLGVSRFAGLQIAVPSLGEQRRIAAILSAVNEGIEVTQAVIDQLQVVKKAMMAELLTRGLPGQHTRFKQTEAGSIPESWSLVAICELGEAKLGRMRSPVYSTGRNRPYLRVANVLDGEIDTSDVLEMPFEDAQFEKFRLQLYDILLNEGQSLELVGRPAMYRGNPPDCAFQKTLLRFRPGPRLDPEYALATFQSWLYNGRFAEHAVQTTSIAHLTLVRFSAMTMPVPDILEQRAIARSLASVGQRISAERNQLAAYVTLKQALSSSLLTGEIRVTPDEVVR